MLEPKSGFKLGLGSGLTKKILGSIHPGTALYQKCISKNKGKEIKTIKTVLRPILFHVVILDYQALLQNYFMFGEILTL